MFREKLKISHPSSLEYFIPSIYTHFRTCLHYEYLEMYEYIIL